ncbi:UDP-N-acetylmuramate dehydrogenase [bacterium]|nr:UDP-N-acetylmuramate dehydrogenase [bacterium]
MMTSIALRENVPLAPFTSWRVGGPARYFFEPDSVPALQEALGWAAREGLKVFVLGKGSNLLISDEGFDGLVIRLGSAMGAVSVEGETVRAGAGCATNILMKACAEQDRGGFEFLTTIPGTLGGVVFMNGGAHGACMADFLVEATVLMPDLSIRVFSNAEMGYSYRHSRLHDEGGVVLEAVLRTEPKPKAEVQQAVSELAKWRRARQPQGLSAGSVFTNPPGTSAGRLIEEAGCKGLTVGRAQVSEVHANFFVNMGGAKAEDLLSLIVEVQRRVHAAHGLWLHPEVRGVGCTVGVPESRA